MTKSRKADIKRLGISIFRGDIEVEAIWLIRENREIIAFKSGVYKTEENKDQILKDLEVVLKVFPGVQPETIKEPYTDILGFNRFRSRLALIYSGEDTQSIKEAVKEAVGSFARSEEKRIRHIAAEAIRTL